MEDALRPPVSADIKRLLRVYYEQNVTKRKYEDYDGDRWIVFGDMWNVEI